MKALIQIFVAWMTIVVSSQASLAQFDPTPLPADEAFPLSVVETQEGLAAIWDVPEGYYLYRDRMSLETPGGGSLDLDTPSGTLKDDPTFGRTEIYRGRVSVPIPRSEDPLTIGWQGCQEGGICYAPQSRRLDAYPGARSELSAVTLSSPSRAQQVPATNTSADPAGLVETLTMDGGPAFVVIAFFGFGVLLSLTPCVFPMIPIVAGMVVGRDGVTPRRGLALSGAYVIAMATAFAGLGIVAAWSGQNLQLALQSPAALIVASGVFTVLALSMFEVFDLQLPGWIASRVVALRGRDGSLHGAALLGVTSALIVGPCVTAPLAGALLYIARTGDIALGAGALFALGLGQGMPLLGIGMFGPKVLPRSGAWMTWVKSAFGVILLGIAIWLAARAVPAFAGLAFYAALLVGTGAWLLAADRDRPGWKIARSLGAILAVSGVIQGIGAGLGATDPFRPLGPLVKDRSAAAVETSAFETVTTAPDLRRAMGNASGATVIYVTADWCAMCRALERGPLSDPDVRDALASVSAIKFDVTQMSADSRAALEDIGSFGPPTMIVLDEAGRAAPGTPLVGKISAADIRAALSGVGDPGT